MLHWRSLGWSTALLCALAFNALMPAAAQTGGANPAPPAAEADADDELPNRLAACQSDEQSSADRHAHCTWVIERLDLAGDIRAEGFLNRAIVHLNEGNVALALPDLDKAITLNPTYPAPYAYRGEAHDTTGDPVKALADYDKAITLDPINADLIANRGEIHRKKGDKAKAKADFEAALLLDKENRTAVDGLAALEAAQ